MTYEQANTIIKAMGEIETWAGAAMREQSKPYGEIDWAELKKYEQWTKDAKEVIFNIMQDALSK